MNKMKLYKRKRVEKVVYWRVIQNKVKTRQIQNNYSSELKFPWMQEMIMSDRFT